MSPARPPSQRAAGGALPTVGNVRLLALPPRYHVAVTLRSRRRAVQLIRSVAYPLRAEAGARDANDSAARDAFTDPLGPQAGTGDAHDPTTNRWAATGAGPRPWTVLDQQNIAIGRVGSSRQRCRTLMGMARRCERGPNGQHCRKDEYRHFQHLRAPLFAPEMLTRSPLWRN
jgi:hypothetical protein